jgi:hypothetical protein
LKAEAYRLTAATKGGWIDAPADTTLAMIATTLG